MRKSDTAIRNVSLGGFFMSVLLCASCSMPNYLGMPELEYPVLENVCSFGIQNMDEHATVDDNSLACHYDGFDVFYRIDDKFVVSLLVANHSNKSLIIDKSKCYVLYDGYSTQLFKDVRSSRSTTFNNVQDAINNVQTNESGVSMTIPPYSKWELPINETNIREIKKLPHFIDKIGIHALTPYDDGQETVEFVIPYTFDYALADWNTCRNRLFVKSIEVRQGFPAPYRFSPEIQRSSELSQYLYVSVNGDPNYSELQRVDELNWKMYKKHLKRVRVSHGIWGTILFPCGIFPSVIIWMWRCPHEPQKYWNRR